MEGFPKPGDMNLYDGIKEINKDNYQEALKYFEQGSRHDNEYAALFEAIFHFAGFGLERRDPSKSIDLLRKIATTWSNSVAQYLIGCMYLEGDSGVYVDTKSAIHWLTLAANNGWSDAMALLGNIYLSGSVVKEDHQKALYWLEKVSAKDDSDTEPIRDGKLCLFGNQRFELNMDNISEESGQLLERISQEGGSSPVKTLNNLGAFKKYFDDKLVVHKIFWLTLTNKKSTGVAACQFLLMAIYLEGSNNVRKNPSKIIYWAKKAAKNGNSSACMALGTFYEGGVNVQQDYKEAMNWYKRSQESGDKINAVLGIGLLYYKGNGVKRDCMVALEYFKTIVDKKKNGLVHYLMGDIYQYGKDRVPQDYKKAFEHYTEAVAVGHYTAATKLGMLYRLGLGVGVNEERAYHWFTKAASLGCPEAQFALGLIHYSGSSGKKDLNKALGFFKKSYAGGYEASKNMITRIECVNRQ